MHASHQLDATTVYSLKNLCSVARFIIYGWGRQSMLGVGTRNLRTAIYGHHIGQGAFILSIARRKNIFPELACEGSKQKDYTHTEPSCQWSTSTSRCFRFHFVQLMSHSCIFYLYFVNLMCGVPVVMFRTNWSVCMWQIGRASCRERVYLFV